jgi:hypothetical protein
MGKKKTSIELLLELKENIRTEVIEGLIKDGYEKQAVFSVFNSMCNINNENINNENVENLVKNEDVLRAMYDSLLRKAKIALYQAGRRYGLDDKLTQIFDENSDSADYRASLAPGSSSPSSKEVFRYIVYAGVATMMAGDVGAYYLLPVAALNGKNVSDVSEQISLSLGRIRKALHLVIPYFDKEFTPDNFDKKGLFVPFFIISFCSNFYY